MRKTIYLSLCCVGFLSASEELGDIDIVEQATSEVVENVSSEEIKSADLAETLQKNIPSVSMIRRSGIANDIILRGQTRDNINVVVDGTKIYGACVNRMDPPTSHIVTHAVDNVEIVEGPFDVEDFGTLSGAVKVTTKKPSKDLSGEVEANIGSFGYKKYSGTLSGGTDRVRMLFTASTESSDQYKDGDGNDLATQLANYTKDKGLSGYNYAPKYKSMDAFEKTMIMGKLFVDVADNQEVRLSYTANRSDDVLYPSSKMDAIYDDSDIANLEYIGKDLGKYSKKLYFQVYNSQVEHPMSTQYRNIGQEKYMTHKLTTEMTGVKLKNSVDIIGDREITYGIDGSKRNWDGHYYMTMVSNGMTKKTGTSIDDVDTKNVGVFLKSKRESGNLKIEWGARYDDTSVETGSNSQKDRNFYDVSANVFATYKLSDNTNIFAGAGKSSRVPDARELYNTKYKKLDNGSMKKILNGNPDLKQTRNYEVDLGAEQFFTNGKIKVKTFYSKLRDYIYYNGSKMKNSFENIDAYIYGAELSGNYSFTDDLNLNAGVAYKKGRKNTLPTGQSDRDLADISPVKLNASLSYDYDDQGFVQLSVVSAGKWKDIDSDNGEQELDGYTVLNLKTSREFDNGIVLSAGVDNITDETYTTTNTYKDLILMTDNTNTMLINEPGRYFYVDAKYQF
jgi:iron complex outermembrane receptor protein